MQYSNFKDTLQNIASQIGNVEQEVEEHKYVLPPKTFHITLSSLQILLPNTCDAVSSPRNMANQLQNGQNKCCYLMLAKQQEHYGSGIRDIIGLHSTLAAVLCRLALDARSDIRIIFVAVFSPRQPDKTAATPI